jgi:hypothetical protein
MIPSPSLLWRKMMKRIHIRLLFVFLFCASSVLALDSYYGLPIKYVAGYEADLNLDHQNDLVFLIEKSEGYELTALIRIKNGYKAYTLLKTKEKVIVTCKFGKKIVSTEAGKGEGNARTYQIPGPYIEVSQPEGASSVFYWKKGKFYRVWISD